MRTHKQITVQSDVTPKSDVILVNSSTPTPYEHMKYTPNSLQKMLNLQLRFMMFTSIQVQVQNDQAQ